MATPSAVANAGSAQAASELFRPIQRQADAIDRPVRIRGSHVTQSMQYALMPSFQVMYSGHGLRLDR